VAGVHYPSDSEAGRLLARQITNQLLEVESFQALVEAARAEHPRADQQQPEPFSSSPGEQQSLASVVAS